MIIFGKTFSSDYMLFTGNSGESWFVNFSGSSKIIERIHALSWLKWIIFSKKI